MHGRCTPGLYLPKFVTLPKSSGLVPGDIRAHLASFPASLSVPISGDPTGFRVPHLIRVTDRLELLTCAASAILSLKSLGFHCRISVPTIDGLVVASSAPSLPLS